jgi:hypothetical protein
VTFNCELEKHAYGSSWAKQAEGYLSNPDVAKDYVAAIMRIVHSAVPSAIADLGGGTGFIFSQLIETYQVKQVLLAIEKLEVEHATEK